jgi:O-antigen/teichoic acid export membrane protein
MFLKTRKLAFSSLFLMATGVLFYELDPFVIGKLLGAPQVALYAVGLTLLSYFRAVFGTFYSPFSARFNHFVGADDRPGLKEIYRKVVVLAAPAVILPVLTVIVFMKPLVYSWVGPAYDYSVPLSRMLVGTFAFGFLGYPASALMVAQQRLRLLNLLALAQPAVYWAGALLCFSGLGLAAFALSKLLVFALAAAVYFIFSKEFLEVRAGALLKTILAPALLPLALLFCAYIFVAPALPLDKGNLNFLISATVICALSAMLIALYCLCSRRHRGLWKVFSARIAGLRDVNIGVS